MIADMMTGLVTRHYLTNRAHVAIVSLANVEDVVDWLVFHEVPGVSALYDDAIEIRTPHGVLRADAGDVVSVDAAGVRVMSMAHFDAAYGDQR